MSILGAGSYALKVGYIPKCIKKLDMLLVDVTTGKFLIKDISLANHINNVIIKIGFVLLSRQYLEETIKGKQVESNFFLSNFIFDTKAFLDALAIVLNHCYNLGFTEGGIDFKKGSFTNALQTQKPLLAKHISKQQKWINEVIDWRENLIHRKSSPIVYYYSPNQTGIAPKDFTVRMPMEPISLFGNEESLQLKQKCGHIEQEILPFCDRWITEAKQLLETILGEVEKDYKPQN